MSRGEGHLEVLRLLLELLEGPLAWMVGRCSQLLVHHPGGHLGGQLSNHLFGKGHMISEDAVKPTEGEDPKPTLTLFHSPPAWLYSSPSAS